MTSTPLGTPAAPTATAPTKTDTTTTDTTTTKPLDGEDASGPTIATDPGDVDRQPVRARQRLVLPDLSTVSSWDAFGTSRRSTAARPAAAPAQTSTPVGRPGAVETSTGPVADPVTGSAAAIGLFGGTAPDGAASGAAVSPVGGTAPDEAASGDPADRSAPTASGDGDRRRGLRGLFRRSRRGVPVAGAGEPEADLDERGRDRVDEPVPAHDEEYIDWVSGLSGPGPETTDDAEGPVRRSLRPSGRHHAD